jgi:Protein of unknown function (DUF3800)
MLVCYLDDSGTDKEAPVLTMAGYVASFTGWTLFEYDAKKTFADFKVSVLHGKEFNDTKGDFEEWSRRKKEAFAARLYRDLTKVVHFGVTASIKKAAHARAKSLGEQPSESPYGHCFRQILNQIMPSAVMKTAAMQGGTLSFVVEAGNKNDADVVRVFNEEKWSPRHIGIEKYLKKVSFADKTSCIALQMADFLAYHARRYVMQCEKARAYLPLSDFHKVVFHAVPTAVCINYEFRTNEEIEAGIIDPNRWRSITPWMP